jgi:hypothetical protein
MNCSTHSISASSPPPSVLSLPYLRTDALLVVVVLISYELSPYNSKPFRGRKFPWLLFPDCMAGGRVRRFSPSGLRFDITSIDWERHPSPNHDRMP